MKLIGATFTLRDDLILSDRLTVPFKKKIGGLGGGRVVGAGGGGDGPYRTCKDVALQLRQQCGCP